MYSIFIGFEQSLFIVCPVDSYVNIL